MGYKKYDENELWQEFLASDERNVYTWANQKFGKKTVNNSGTLKKIFHGWTKRKSEVMAKKSKEVEEMLQQVNNDLKKNLIQGKKKVINLMMVYLNIVASIVAPIINKEHQTEEDQQKVLKALELHKLSDVWEIIKTELGEPTKVSKNENINTDKAAEEFQKLLSELEKLK